MTRYMYISSNWWTDLKLPYIVTCSYRIISIFVLQNRVCMEKIFVEDINFGEYKIYRSNDNFGLFDSEDNQLLPFLYDAFEYDKGIIQSTIIVVQNGKKGVFTLSRNEQRPSRILIPTFYDSIVKDQITTYKYYTSDIFYCYRDKSVDVWDEAGTMIFSDVLDEVLFATESAGEVLFIGIKKSGRCGVFSSALRYIALPCEFDTVSEPIDGIEGKVLFEVSKNGLQGVVQITSASPYYKQVIPIEYEELHAIGKYIIIKSDDRYGVFDYNGPLTECEFDTYDLFEDSCCTDVSYSPIYLSLSRGGIYYLYQDEKLIEFPGKITAVYSDKCVVFEKGGYLGIANFEGKILVKPLYTKISLYQTDDDVCFGDVFEPSVFKLEKHGKYGMFSLTFNTLIPCTYDSIYEESKKSGFYVAKTRNGFSIYDYKLSCAVPFGYERYDKFEYGDDSYMSIDTFFKVYLNGKVGVYSDSGQCVPCTYDAIDIIDLSNWLCIDWLGEDDVKYGLWFIVTNKGKKGLINLRGELLIPCVCDDIDLTYDLYVSYKGNEYNGMTLSQINRAISEEQYEDD